MDKGINFPISKTRKNSKRRNSDKPSRTRKARNYILPYRSRANNKNMGMKMAISGALAKPDAVFYKWVWRACNGPHIRR